MKNGFTLLELVIVVIIIGVLASLALPRMVSMIEGSRSAEAISALTSIRSALERYYLMHPGEEVFASSDQTETFEMLGLDDPGSSPGSNFGYLASISMIGGEASFFSAAVRNYNNNGSPYSGALLLENINFIYLGVNETMIALCGFGNFRSVSSKDYCDVPENLVGLGFGTVSTITALGYLATNM
ncbi:MAG: prepilin-type N-terminal cleavage/methylation domain-containing protein [Candidatus Omnitrophota bacterium]